MHAHYDEAHRQEVCCAPLPAADIGSSSRGSSQRPAGDPRRSPVPGNGGLWRRSVGSISRVERREEAAEHRRSDCPEEVARMQPRVPPTMAAEQAGVSKIGSWWRLASVPPVGEGGVATRAQEPLANFTRMVLLEVGLRSSSGGACWNQGRYCPFDQRRRSRCHHMP